MYAIESLDLSTTPASLTSLDLSQISGMDDKTFQTLFSKKSYNKVGEMKKFVLSSLAKLLCKSLSVFEKDSDVNEVLDSDRVLYV